MIYRYKCPKCGVVIELVQSPDQVGPHQCECGGIRYRHFTSADAQIIGGQGFASKPYYDPETNREYTMDQIRAIDKSGVRVWESHENIAKECQKNHKRNLEEERASIAKGVGDIFAKTMGTE